MYFAYKEGNNEKDILNVEDVVEKIIITKREALEYAKKGWKVLNLSNGKYLLPDGNQYTIRNVKG